MEWNGDIWDGDIWNRMGTHCSSGRRHSSSAGMRDGDHDGSYVGNWQAGEYCRAVRGVRSEDVRGESVRDECEV